MTRFDEGTGAALVVALGSLAFFALLAWAIAFLLWIGLSIYALVEMVGDGRPSALAVLLVVVSLVGALSTLFAVAVVFAGRSLTPRKRLRD
jgi:hypothetical protein